MWQQSKFLIEFAQFLSSPAVDCLDPTCSGRGVCVRGECHCSVGWGGTNCETPRATCLDQCTGHGTFLPETGLCSCDPSWTGHDCSIGNCTSWLFFHFYPLLEQSRCLALSSKAANRYKATCWFGWLSINMGAPYMRDLELEGVACLPPSLTHYGVKGKILSRDGGC